MDFFLALLASLATSLVQTVIYLVVKGISGRGIRRAGRGYTPSFKQHRDDLLLQFWT